MNPFLPLPEDLDRARAEAERAADELSLPLGRRVWKGQAGDFSGGGVGSSLDFQDHRTYVPGDDPRHINWQAYARSGTYTMKLFREEVRPLVDVLWDVSGSMFFDPPKRRRSLELFYFTLFAVLKTGAAGRFHLVHADGGISLPQESLFDPSWITQIPPLSASQSSSPPDLGGILLRPQAMRLFVSDLLFDAGPEPLLRRLADHRGFGLVLAPFTLSEARPIWSGNYEFIDAESGSRHASRVQDGVLQRYRNAYARHFDDWKHLGRKYDIALARVPAEPSLPEALSHEALPQGSLTPRN